MDYFTPHTKIRTKRGAQMTKEKKEYEEEEKEKEVLLEYMKLQNEALKRIFKNTLDKNKNGQQES